jgi:hypothetical protein
MKRKRTIENLIRGWLPSTPTMPHHQNRTPALQSTKALANPLPPVLENRFQRNGGIVIGLGIGLLLIGAVGALIASQTYSEVQRFLSYDGVETNNYLLRDLIDQITIYLTIIVAGAVAVIWGGLILRSQTARDETLNKRPRARLAHGLMGGGGTLALWSTRSLFSYILTSKYIELELFIPMFIIGIILVSCGFLAWRNK